MTLLYFWKLGTKPTFAVSSTSSQDWPFFLRFCTEMINQDCRMWHEYKIHGRSLINSATKMATCYIVMRGWTSEKIPRTEEQKDAPWRCSATAPNPKRVDGTLQFVTTKKLPLKKEHHSFLDFLLSQGATQYTRYCIVGFLSGCFHRASH